MKMLIMAGGQGTRFWPMSRISRPKQFLELFRGKSLFQLTVERLSRIVEGSDIYVVCSEQYLDQVLDQAPDLSAEQVIVEPVPRNTAPCIGLAAVRLESKFPGEVMGVFPSDHLILDEGAFREACRKASNLAGRGNLVTLGIKPQFPATGFGYLQQGAPVEASVATGAFKVERFTEKPDSTRAGEFLDSGDFLWNSGMFFWKTSAILESIRTHLPHLHNLLESLRGLSPSDPAGHEIFRSAESISIDYGVMEKSDNVVVVPCDLQWSDVGDWNAVAELVEGGENERFPGLQEAVSVESGNCFVVSGSGKKVALAGVEDLILVETDDAILVCSRKHSQDVGKIVKLLKDDSPELL